MAYIVMLCLLLGWPVVGIPAPCTLFWEPPRAYAVEEARLHPLTMALNQQLRQANITRETHPELIGVLQEINRKLVRLDKPRLNYLNIRAYRLSVLPPGTSEFQLLATVPGYQPLLRLEECVPYATYRVIAVGMDGYESESTEPFYDGPPEAPGVVQKATPTEEVMP